MASGEVYNNIYMVHFGFDFPPFRPKFFPPCRTSEREGLTDRRILFVLPESVWPPSADPSQWTASLMTDRRIQFFFTESVWPSSAYPSPADRIDDDADDGHYFFAIAIGSNGVPMQSIGSSTTINRTHRSSSF
jgi:hypothetical protein